MTNGEIVLKLKESLGIDPIVPMLTYKEWQRNGYQVKKGEHGIPCLLWQHTQRKVKEGKQIIPTDENGEELEGYIRVKTTLFLPNQIERIKQ